MSAQDQQGVDTRIAVISPSEMTRLLVYRMAQRFKDISPAVAERIDSAAAEITGKAWSKRIVSLSDPAMGGARNRPALHFESEAGQGKTYIVEAACKKFCEVAGLNFVSNPPEHYVPNKNDFYFFTVNMIGQYNPSEAGGLPVKLTLGEGKTGDSLIEMLHNRVSALAEMTDKPITFKQTEQSGLDVAKISVNFEKDNISKKVWVRTCEWLQSTLAGSNGKLVLLNEGEEPSDDAFSVRCNMDGGPGKLEIEYFEPKKAVREMAVMGKLPNASWAKASHAAGSMMFVDEVDKISPAIRHLLLEIAQFGRVSGTANLGEHYMVVLAGNLGDRGDVNDFNDSVSQATVAEGTRMERYRLVATPEDWANHIDSRFAGQDNAHAASFIRRYGNQPGIFRPEFENPDFDPSRPCANARSVENAMIESMKMLLEADYSGVSREVVFEDPEYLRTMRAIAGEPFASAYVGHVKAMETMAVPLADHIFAAKSEDLEDIEGLPLSIKGVEGETFISLMEKKTGGFAFRDPDHQAFAQRLSDALTSRTIRDYLKAHDQQARCDVLSKGFAGLAILSREAHNAGISLINAQLRKLQVDDSPELSDQYYDAVSNAIARTLNSGFHHVPGLQKEEQISRLEEVRTDIQSLITGYRAPSLRPQ